MPYGGTIFGPVSADLLPTDVEAIVQGLSGPAEQTLSDLQERLQFLAGCLTGSSGSLLADQLALLADGLFDPSGPFPYLQNLGGALNSYLYNSQGASEPWLATVDRSIRDGFTFLLYDPNALQPWLQTLHADLLNQLRNGAASEPWLETLHSLGRYGLLDSLGFPWLETIRLNLDYFLFDWMNNRPLLESVRLELAALRAVLEDVHDAAQHALRTV